MAMKDIPVFGLVFARFTVETTTFSDNGFVAGSAKVAGQTSPRSERFCTRRAVELLLLDITLGSGLVLRLWPLIADGFEVEELSLLGWTSLGLLLRIPFSPDLFLPLERCSGHEFQLFSSEIEVIDSFDDAFTERIVGA
jgi:hypothetical protein